MFKCLIQIKDFAFFFKTKKPLTIKSHKYHTFSHKLFFYYCDCNYILMAKTLKYTAIKLYNSQRTVIIFFYLCNNSRFNNYHEIVHLLMSTSA